MESEEPRLAPPPLLAEAPLAGRRRARPPFLIVSGAIGLACFLIALLLISEHAAPPLLAWLLLAGALGILVLTLLPRKPDAADPAAASFVPFAAAVVLALLLYNGLTGGARAEHGFATFVVVSFSPAAEVVLLRPVEGSRSYAFHSADLRRELAELEGAQVAARLRVTRSFGSLHAVALLELDGRARSLEAFGWIESDARRRLLPGGPRVRLRE